MPRIEKTIFICYRRTDVYTALAVYESLKNQGYDVFFDYQSISSGIFEHIILSNIRARAHFLIILTPTALDHFDEPGDWIRREIEFAIDEKRNIIPLFFRGFQFSPFVIAKLTGKLKNLSRYNGLNVHEDYFDEGMRRLTTQFLNVPLETVLHPVSTEVQRVVKEEQIAADQALKQFAHIQERVKWGEDKLPDARRDPEPKIPIPHEENNVPLRFIGVITIMAGLLIICVLALVGVNFLLNLPVVTSEPTRTNRPSITNTPTNLSTSTSSPVPTRNAAATAFAESVNLRIKDYVEKGYLATTRGNLDELDDLSFDYAQRNYISAFDTGFYDRVESFAVWTHIKWDVSTDGPETAGCGFAYRVQENGIDGYNIFLTRDRILADYCDGATMSCPELGLTRGKGLVHFSYPAEADLELIVNEEHAYVLVNEEFVAQYTLFTGKLKSGYLQYAVLSNINSGYGTHCEFTDGAVWAALP